MEIFKHKEQGLVVLFGKAKMRRKDGAWTTAIMYRQLKLENPKDIDATGKGKAELQAQIYVEPSARWVAQARSFGKIDQVYKKPTQEQVIEHLHNKEANAIEAAKQAIGATDGEKGSVDTTEGVTGLEEGKTAL